MIESQCPDSPKQDKSVRKPEKRPVASHLVMITSGDGDEEMVTSIFNNDLLHK